MVEGGFSGSVSSRALRRLGAAPKAGPSFALSPPAAAGSLALLGMTIQGGTSGTADAVPCYILGPRHSRRDRGAIRYPRARFLIQMGVPTKPNALRIWFSRKR